MWRQPADACIIVNRHCSLLCVKIILGLRLKLLCSIFSA